jgi:hypothetical protein
LRGKQLSQVREQLQSEIRSSTATSRGVDNLAYLNELIKRSQEVLYEEEWWPFLKAEKNVSRKTLAADQRYYDAPAGINRDRVKAVHHKYSASVWVPIDQGIGPEEYTAYDSDDGATADPALRWDWHGLSQFEVWPMPASDGGLIWFEAMIPLPQVNDDNDILVLDDRAIVLRAAAEILAADGHKDAQAKLSQAQTRVNMLMGNVSSKKRIVLGGDRSELQRGRIALRAVYARD